MIPLPQFVRNYLSQIIASGVVLGLGIGGCMLRDASIEERGVVKEQVRVVKEATKTDATAATKRRSAESNPDGVLAKYTRD